jgi:acyl-CoA synthetase (AMP-forming)/AMP-acid ligase II
VTAQTVESAPSSRYRAGGAAPTIPDVTIPEYVLGPASERGSKVALVEADSGRTLTYAELVTAVRRVGTGLANCGVGATDVVALCAPNSIDFVVSWYAASSIGAIVTTINPLSTGEEIVRHLRRSGARWLITTAELFAEKAGAVAAACGISETFVIGWRPGRHPAGVPFESLWLTPAREAVRGAVQPTDIAFLPSSSGTTGLPKSVVLTHRNLVASLSQTRVVHRATEADTVLAVLPLFHIFGLQLSMNLALVEGATVIVLPRFDLESFLKAVQDHAVTIAAVVPPIILALAQNPAVDGYDLSSLRVLTSGAAPLGGDLARACAARLGCRIRQGYGLTELGGGTHIAPEDGPDRPDSIGPPLPGVDARVIDPDTGQNVQPGQPGELLVRAPGAMLGYLDDPEATAAAIDPDGWVHTGDIVTVDAAGWYYVTDRIKELIKYNGFQVAPAELEAILVTHPAVADAAVVPSSHPAAGEVPKAFIVLRAPATAAEVMRFVADRVAPYKRVRRLEFIEAIPKSPSGKILRRVLVEGERAAPADARPTGGR